MSCWAVVPACAFHRGKTRLVQLSEPERARFAQELLEHVLAQIAAADLFERVLVATDGDQVEQLARRVGAEVIRDLPGATLGRVVDLALQRAADSGATSAVVIMSDLPWLQAADLNQVVARLQRVPVVVVPDGADEGTNVLALQLPAGFATCFGHHDSCSRHVAAVQACGPVAEVYRNPRLAFDIDLPQDLAALRAGDSTQRSRR